MKKIKGMLTFLFLIGIGVVVLTIANDYTPSSGLFKREEVPPPNSLHSTVNEAKNTLITKSAEKGIEVVITDGHRTEQEQNELYERGRTKAGLVVTNVEGGESYHNYGLAIDFALKLDDGDVVWDMKRDDNANGKADWMEVVSIAKDLGFQWGGDWTSFKDYPHLQMNFGLTIRELKYGERPDSGEYATK
nr:M15 family metallopeptidase [Pseudalkalibacillus hwajinpoensis]